MPRFLHRINDEWVRATTRTSPAVIVSLLEVTTPQIPAFWAAADLDAIGEPVSWAGPDPAPVWLDCARDFTEYWIHREQIRDAVGGTAPDVPAEVHAVLDTFLRAVPYTLACCVRADGSTVSVHVDGPGGGRWSWRHIQGRWLPADDGHAHGTVVTFDDPGTLWRLCARMLTPAEASRRAAVTGDDDLAGHLLQIVSIIR